MNFMQARPRARHRDHRFNSKVGVAACLAALLVSCGGGGDDGPGAGSVGGGGGSPPTPSRTDAEVGDYFIYEKSATTTLPAGGGTTLHTETETYRAVVADGTNQRVITYTHGQATGARTYNVHDAVISNDGYPDVGVVICSYSPPMPAAPPYPRAVGQSWSGASQFICRTSTAAFVQTGQIVARESLVLPVGTFDAYRATRTSTATGATGVYTETSICWYGVQRGMRLRCDTTSSRVLTGANAPDQVLSMTEVLAGLGGPNRVAQGIRP